MLKRTKVYGAVVAALSGVAVCAPHFAFAQTVERVEVTGSRIKRTEIETSQPIYSLSREEITAQGLTSIGDVIQNLTANTAALNTTFNNGGNGETQVSLRGLGGNRALVLVNGRRWVGGTGLGGAVDLNTIPAAAVERIEVLKDGASVIYGSDAIAGVINVILRNNFDGAEINAYSGRFQQGDGARSAADLTIGSAGKRFRGMLGVGYVKEEPVSAGARPISAEPVFSTGTALGSSTTPFGRFTVCNGTWNSASGTCSGTQTQPNGAAGQFTYNPGQQGLNYRAFTANDFYNFAPENYLLTPQERISVFGRASFDVSDSTQFELQATFNNRKSEQLLAAMPIVLGTGPGAGTIARTIAISESNIYNPFGKPVVRIQRRAVETGGRSFNQDVSTVAFSGALKGEVSLMGKALNWELGAAFMRNSQSDTTIGLFNLIALRNALGPSMRNASGQPVCVSTAGNLATAIPGCVPMNLLGAAGTITRDMLNYSTFEAHDSYGYTNRSQWASLSGEIMKLPAGPLSFAAGLEQRFESGFDAPDALINSGNTTGNARTATKGGFTVQEAFAELSVPLLKNLPVVRSLDLTLASRTSDYSNFGGTTNSKAGLLWKVNKEASLRANWSQGFRAPSISELFQGLSDSFPQLADPCSTTFGGGYNSLTAEAKARCTAAGVPVGGYDQGNAQIRISVGGNPLLKPEKSITQTAGLVFSPDRLAGFDVSVDWWRIELKDAIGPLSASTILSLCIRQGDPQACQLVQRAPGGQITSLIQSGVNTNKIRVEGIDVTMNYRLPKTRFGNFSFQLDTTYAKNEQVNDGPNTVGQYSGSRTGGTPRTRANFVTRWERGSLGATWGMRHFSEMTEDCSIMVSLGKPEACSDPANAQNRIGGTTYHDISAYWKAPWKARITVGANNAFSKNPPISYSTFANSFDPRYDVPGAFYYMRYSQSF